MKLSKLNLNHKKISKKQAMEDMRYLQKKISGKSVYANNGFDQRFGNSVNRVLSGTLAGNNWTLSSLGFPLTTGISTSGTNIFGQDYYYQYVRDQLCVHSGGHWYNASNAGVWSAVLSNTRAIAFLAVGFRAASYLVG